jgi:hypothetical protein
MVWNVNRMHDFMPFISLVVAIDLLIRFWIHIFLFLDFSGLGLCEHLY